MCSLRNKALGYYGVVPDCDGSFCGISVFHNFTVSKMTF